MAKIIGLADLWLRRKRKEHAVMTLTFEKEGLDFLYWIFEAPMGLYASAGIQGKQQWAAKKKSEQKLARQLRKWFYAVILSGETKVGKAKVLDGWTGALPQESIDLLKQMVEHYDAVGMTAPFVPMYLSAMDTLNGETDSTVGELLAFKDPAKQLQFKKEGLRLLRLIFENPVGLFARVGMQGKQQWQAKDKAAQKQVRRLRKWFSVAILGDLKDTSDFEITDPWIGALPTDAVDRLKEMVEHYTAVGMTAQQCDDYLSLWNTLTGETDNEDALIGYSESSEPKTA